MPQQTNLNVSPYFDDFDREDQYYRVLFKPGYPIQARELTTLQSMLQSQIEQMGDHFFKEGSVVIPGNINYIDNYYAVELQESYLGINILAYLPYLIGKTIRGSSSGVRASIVGILAAEDSERDNNTIYVNFLNSDTATNTYQGFSSNEVIIVESGISEPNTLDPEQSTILQPNEGFAVTITTNPNSIGSAVNLSEGVYYLRGHFVTVEEQTILLDQYDNNPSYRVGLDVFELIETPDDNIDLNDNAQGFSNYAAPGADRLIIDATLAKIPLDDPNPTATPNFVQLLEVRNGILQRQINNPDYNIIEKELARRTYDESGNYYVKSPSISVKETLDDLKGNGGIFRENQLTYNNNKATDDLATYTISPLKAFVSGYEIDVVGTTYLDFEKTRTTKLLTDQSVNYVTGPTYTLNRVYGSPSLGISTSYTLSLRNSRVGSDQIGAAGKEIGLARVYDFALESGSYNTSTPDTNEWDIALYDIQTYTEISLNEPITLTSPTHIKGKSSGAVGFLRYNATNSGIITAYNTKGTFVIGEKFIFDGIENTRVSTAITAYSSNDVKSLYGIVGSASTFTADVKQSPLFNIGQVEITADGGGISTVTSSDFIFSGIATVGNIVAFSNPGLQVNTFAKIETVSQSSLTISGITTVSGVCDGALPSSNINPSDFRILFSNFQSSSDNTLYTTLPKRNVASTDLTNSSLTIRKQYDVTISSNATNTILAESDETFLSFDEERYVLITDEGVTESLSADKLVFSNGGREITIFGLSTSSGTGKLIATLRKVDIDSKIKRKNRVQSIIVDKSKYAYSGTGSTTNNDGLTYGTYPYGARVQDEEICLLQPDVTVLYGIYESNDTSDPELPTLTLTSLNGPTAKTDDLLIGEEFVGSSSGAVGLYAEKLNSLQITYISRNSSRFQSNETITFKESGITATITALDGGDNNITSNYTFDNGQRETIYDYSRIIRKPSSKEPTRKVKIVFESASFSPSDTGDLTTASSYEQFDYCDIPSINGIRNTDIIDIRPRVSGFTVTTSSLSPFEFSARNFTSSGNSASSILASDESILFDYSYYLPRIDKIYLTKDGVFQLNKGEPADNPQPPIDIEDALDIATITLPAYLCDVNEASLNLAEHKRYRMRDISSLENRIKNLEYYTSLSLLETDTSNLFVRDANGLNRFKSGFFVDDFSTTSAQKKVTIVKNSIDVINSELRPSPYTTQVDLILGSNSLIGLGGTNPNADPNFVSDLIGTNVKKTGGVITLDYYEVEEINQPYATRVESVAPYRVGYYGGTINLTPSSDIWVDVVRLSANSTEVATNYIQSESQIVASELDSQTGFGPVTWGSWETVWTGSTKAVDTRTVNVGYYIVKEDLETVTKTGTSTRTGVRKITKEELKNVSLGDTVLSTDISSFMRSRNIEFVSRRLKPFTRVYTFFNGVNVNKFVTPKLLEITMVSGTFQVGETIRGIIESSVSASLTVAPVKPDPEITFRVATSNHKYGPYDAPTEIFTANPYNSTQPVPADYSSTSTILNVDTFSISQQAQGDFFGYVQTGMKLRGQTSGAEAVVSDIRLITDTIGVLIGSFYIPNPNVFGNPRFETGPKLFRITSSVSNSSVDGTTTSAEEKFFSEGKINRVQENILSVRTVRTETQTITESRAESLTGPTAVVATTIVGNTLPPYVPPAPPVVPAEPPAVIDYFNEPAPPSYPPVQETPFSGGYTPFGGGYGPFGGGYVGPTSCPDPLSRILMSDGSLKMAKDLLVGDYVRTQHENTLEWGDFKVSHVSIVNNSQKLKLIFDNSQLICSTTHKLYFNEMWSECTNLSIGDMVSGQILQNIERVEDGDVVKITIEDAHTYICEGLLSHNKSLPPLPTKTETTIIEDDSPAPGKSKPPKATKGKAGIEYLPISYGPTTRVQKDTGKKSVAFSVPLQTVNGKTFAQIKDQKGGKAARQKFKDAGLKVTTTDKSFATQQKAIGFKTTKNPKSALPKKNAPIGGAIAKQLQKDKIVKPQKTRNSKGLVSIVPTSINNVPANKGKKNKNKKKK